MPDNLNVYRKVTIASLIMMMSVLLSRAAGFVREMIIAWIGGAGPMVDAYQVAFIIPDILNHIIAGGFMSVTFIPIFTRYLAAGDEEGGWKTFSNILFCFGTLLLVLIAVCMVFAPRLVSLAAPGITDPEMLRHAAYMTRVIMPAQLCFFAGGLLMAVQYSKERFFIPALAPLIYNLGIIWGGLLLGPSMGMYGFAWGVLIGAIVGNLGLQYWGALKIGLKIYPRFKPLDHDLIRYTFLTIPLIVGIGLTFSVEFVFRFFGSYLGAGKIAAMNYALRIMLLLVGFFGQAVGTASYPFMAKMAALGDMRGLNALLDKTVRYLALLIPLSFLVFAVRFEVVRILFERGNFTAQDTVMTGEILGCLLVGAFAFSINTVVVRGYYAVQNTWFPALFGLVFFILSLPLYIWSAVYLRDSMALALVISIASIVQVALLYFMWAYKTRNDNAIKVWQFYLGITAISLVAFAVLWAFKLAVFGAFNPLAAGKGFWYSLMVCISCGVVYSVLGLIAGYLFKIEEIMFVFKKLMRRV